MQRQHHPMSRLPRDRAFWAATTVLLLGQLIAFWMVCSHQMRMAEVRQASASVERLAIADCLRYVPNSTLASCTQRVRPLDSQTIVSATQPRPAGAESVPVPVNYVYH